MNLNSKFARQMLNEANIYAAEVARAEEQRRARIDALLGLVTVGDSPVTGKHTVTFEDGSTASFTVSENNTYDEATILAGLLPGQVRRCSVMKLDKATVKRLYSKVYEGAKVTRGHKVAL